MYTMIANTKYIKIYIALKTPNITLYKLSSIDEYLKITSTLKDKKGILYLDSGNYFEVFK